MTLRCMSSMATRQVLARLAALYAQPGGLQVDVVSLGGVEAARRIAGGEALDVAVLAADAMARLAASGAVLAGSIRAVALSDVAIAVAGSPVGADAAPVTRQSSISRQELIDRLMRAKAIGYSTGPSGTALLAVLEQWDLRPALDSRLVQAPPGVPVGELVARGEVDIGFQQRSELLHCAGITLLGGMPPGFEITTLFSAAVCAVSRDPGAGRRFIDFLCSPAAGPVIGQEGMRPAKNQKETQT